MLVTSLLERLPKFPRWSLIPPSLLCIREKSGAAQLFCGFEMVGVICYYYFFSPFLPLSHRLDSAFRCAWRDSDILRDLPLYSLFFPYSLCFLFFVSLGLALRLLGGSEPRPPEMPTPFCFPSYDRIYHSSPSYRPDPASLPLAAPLVRNNFAGTAPLPGILGRLALFFLVGAFPFFSIRFRFLRSPPCGLSCDFSLRSSASRVGY